jgi:DNA replication protein DnaC
VPSKAKTKPQSRKPIAINFYGGPGTGKSTMAAAIFAELKALGVNCELVTEYAKKKVWEESYRTFECQLYVCAKQIYSMFTVARHVDVLITDSPIIMSSAYNDGDKLLNELVAKEHHRYDNIEIFLTRTKKYNPKGRMQTEKEAREKDRQIRKILNDNKIIFIEKDGDRRSIPSIMLHLNNALSEKGIKI